MNHANADRSPSNARLTESLPMLIEQIGNELEVLAKHYQNAIGLADRLHGAPPPAPAAGLTAVQAEPNGLLEQLRVRCDRLADLNASIGMELNRISNAL